MIAMTRHTAEIIADLLDMAANEFSNYGCNDYIVKNTPENRKLIEDALGYDEAPQNIELQIVDDGIFTFDDLLMRYLACVLRKELANDNNREQTPG